MRAGERPIRYDILSLSVFSDKEREGDRMMTESDSNAYTRMIGRIEREKELVERLTELLREELEFIANQDVESLEESMSEKYRILQDITENRQETGMLDGEPLSQCADRIRLLQQDLVVLWKKASGLNELSKSLVTGRLEEIGNQLDIFFSGEKSGYNRQGKKSGGLPRAINTGA